METRLDVSRQRFVRETAARFFLRFHMSLIFAGAAAGGVLASRWLFVSGVDALAERYALAVVGAYFVFFVLVRGWIFYATRLAPDPGLDAPGGWPGGGGGGRPHVAGGGGQFGGGGASGTFEGGVLPRIEAATPSSGGGGSGFSLDLDDAWLVVLALLVFVACLGAPALWGSCRPRVIWPGPAFKALPPPGLAKRAGAGPTGRRRRGGAR